MTADAPPIVDNPLFFLDYDGTLAPIVERPEEAYPHPEMPELLKDLSERHPVWIVTGRHLRDLNVFLPDSSLQAIGLHGAQRGTLGEKIEGHLSEEEVATLERLRREVPDDDGLRVEDKEQTFAVHYRQADDHEEARRVIKRWAERVPEDFTVIWGKKVVELRPKGMHKGAAVSEVVREYEDGYTPLYIGDDVTDEDAFEALAGQGVTIKVGDGETRARYRLSDVTAVVDYLRQYL